MNTSQKAGSIRAAMRGILRGASSATIAAAAPDEEDKKDGGADDATEEGGAPANDGKPNEKMADPANADGEAGSEGEDDAGKPKENASLNMNGQSRGHLVYEGGSDEATAKANARWATVLRSPQAAGRTDAAVDLLAESTMGADKITALLGKLPAASASTAFADRMSAEAPNPDVKPDGGTSPARNVATRMAERHAPKKGK